METPTEHLLPFLPPRFDDLYGPPPPLRGRSQSFGDLQPDAEMHDVTAHMSGMQLEETKQEEIRQPYQTPDRDLQECNQQQPTRQPFQAVAINRRPRRDMLSVPSPPQFIGTAASCQPNRGRSNSFLVRNAPRLPASPDLDLSVRDDSTSRAELFPPPIFSPLHKYSHVNHNTSNALLRDDLSTNDITISTYWNVCQNTNTNTASSCNSSMAQSPSDLQHHPAPTPPPPLLPPSMPMIGSPSPPVDRKLLKMRKGYEYLQLNNTTHHHHHHQFTMYGR